MGQTTHISVQHESCKPGNDKLLQWHDVNVINVKSHVIWLFNSICGSTSKKHQYLPYWPFVRGIHWGPGSSVDSPHKGPVMQKKLPCHKVVMWQTNPISDNSQSWVQSDFTGYQNHYLWVSESLRDSVGGHWRSTTCQLEEKIKSQCI